MTELRKLREKLCRELSQSEHSAIAQPRREARRLGEVPPARAILAIAKHAEEQRPRLYALVSGRRSGAVGIELGRWIGELFSLLRHYLFDRLIDTERSYRGTLLGVSHGVDIVRLLSAVATREGDERLLQFCEEWLGERQSLLALAQEELAWFAERPRLAVQSGLGRALAPMT
ncbi:hypothetical protein BH11MYX3_BH11MYX3_38860 [soil metagenome]